MRKERKKEEKIAPRVWGRNKVVIKENWMCKVEDRNGLSVVGMWSEEGEMQAR